MAFPSASPKFGSIRNWTRPKLAARRMGPSWVSAEELGQPQDGALEAESAGDSTGVTGSMGLREPEDARLTGGTRSLMRRVMGLNVTKPALHSLRAFPAWSRKPALQ